MKAPGGAVARVILVVENRLPERVYVEHGGLIWVDGLAPDGRRRRLSWGGSSADTAGAGVGRTSRTPVWPSTLPNVDIPILPGATLDIHDVDAWAVGQVGCEMQVDVPG